MHYGYIFDGDYYTIYGLYLTEETDELALFKNLSGKVENVYFKNGFIFSKQVSPLFKKWLIRCYNLGDVIITPTEYSKSILQSYGITRKIPLILC